MINFDNLQPVKNVNTRVNYDLRYSAKTGRFNLSQSAFDKFNIQNNGFNLFRDGDNVIFQVVPNEEAMLHNGREGKQKGLSFTAKSVVRVMGLENTTQFKFNKTEHDGQTYLTLETIGEETDEEEAFDVVHDMDDVENVEETEDVDYAETL